MIIGVEIKASKKNPIAEDLILAVGILSGGVVHPGNSKKKLGSNPPSIAQVAAYNEFGTKKNGVVVLPARPYMRNSLGSSDAEQKIEEIYSIVIPKLNAGELTFRQAAGILGAWAQSAVQAEMDALGVVETGITKRHITWAKVNQDGDTE